MCGVTGMVMVSRVIIERSDDGVGITTETANETEVYTVVFVCMYDECVNYDDEWVDDGDVSWCGAIFGVGVHVCSHVDICSLLLR